MDTWIFSLFLLPVLVTATTTSVNTIATRDYCNGEHFAPSCGDDSLILIHHAQYGRMREGGCITNALNYIGCSSDVTTQFDDVCTGLSSCDVMVTDNHIQTQSGECIKGVMRYLNASYSCHKALRLPTSHCVSSEQLEVPLHDFERVMLSSLAIQQSCLPEQRPWSITAAQGQKLNLTLISLGLEENRGFTYGDVTDPLTKRRVTINHGGQRYTHLLLSESETVTFQLRHGPTQKFLIDIQVLGCASLVPPHGAWISRDNNTLTMGCHGGTKEWVLVCVDNAWRGVLGQCGQGKEEPNAVGIKYISETTRFASSNALLFGLCSFVVLLSAIVFLVAVCVLRRRQENIYGMVPPPTEHDYFSITSMPRSRLRTFSGGHCEHVEQPACACTCDLIRTLPGTARRCNRPSSGAGMGGIVGGKHYCKSIHSVTLPTTHICIEEEEEEDDVFKKEPGSSVADETNTRHPSLSTHALQPYRKSSGSGGDRNTVPRRISRRSNPEPNYHSLRFSFPSAEFGVPMGATDPSVDENQNSISTLNTVEYRQYMGSQSTEQNDSVKYFVLEGDNK